MHPSSRELACPQAGIRVPGGMPCDLADGLNQNVGNRIERRWHFHRVRSFDPTNRRRKTALKAMVDALRKARGRGNFP